MAASPLSTPVQMPQTLFPDATSPSLAGSATARLIDEFDWSATELGPISDWPETLKVCVRLVVSAETPMCLLVGQEGILIYNDGYAEIAGGRHPEILGMGAMQAWPEIAWFNRDVLAKTMAGKCLVFRNQHMRLNRDGQLRDVWLDLNYSPISGPDGRPLGALAILAETTPLMVARRALERRSEQLSLALAASGAIGIWDWDINNDVVTADERFAELYGVDLSLAAEGAPIGVYVAGVYPEDRTYLEQQIGGAIERCGEFSAEYRIQGRDGQLRWVFASGRAIAGPDGKAARLPGAVIDITKRKAQEAALAASEIRFRALADSMPQMVWSTLPDGYHDYYNARWYEFTGVPAGSTDGEAWNGMFHPEDQERAWATWRHSLETGDPYQIEYRLRHHSGQYRWTLGRALPLRDEDGHITRWIGTCTDIHDTKLAAEEREVVAQELSHRIKNIFSVLNGIIALSSRSDPDMKPFADHLRARIAAMGKAHDLVRPHSKSSRPTDVQASLAGLIGQLVAPFQSADAARIRYSGDDVIIDDGAATPLALLFHELATNAAKYGSLSEPGGSVEITGRTDGDSMVLVWTERRVAAAQAPGAAEGFGSRLIQLSVEGQLGGKLQRRWESEGLIVEMTIPVAALSRSSRLGRQAKDQPPPQRA